MRGTVTIPISIRTAFILVSSWNREYMMSRAFIAVAPLFDARQAGVPFIVLNDLYDRDPGFLILGTLDAMLQDLFGPVYCDKYLSVSPHRCLPHHEDAHENVLITHPAHNDRLSVSRRGGRLPGHGHNRAGHRPHESVQILESNVSRLGQHRAQDDLVDTRVLL